MTNDLELAQPKLLRDAAFVGGAWVKAARGIAVTNPADGTVIGHVPDLGEADAIAAVEAAVPAQQAWARETGKARAVGPN
jgi:succinate-semialdehyde dehydrogenase/glutarate-semialdehyde dehydrogenase